MKRKFFLASLFLLIIILLTLGVSALKKIEPSPSNLKITNVSNQGVSLSWTTKTPSLGFALVSKERWQVLLPFFNRFLAKVYPDDRLVLSTTHHLTLKNLEPETVYYYRIGKKIGIFKTASSLEQITTPNPAYGKAVRADLSPARNVIVYLWSSSSSVVSGLTNESGNWTIDLANLRTRDLKYQFQLSGENEALNVLVEGGSQGRFEGLIYTKQRQPTQLLILEK